MRAVLLAITLLLLNAAAAFAEGCVGFSPERFVADVGYFTKVLNPVPTTDRARIAFAHPDDARINVSFHLQVSLPTPPERRSEYVAGQQKALEAYARRFNGGTMTVNTAIYPLDPVAWMVTASEPVGDGVSGKGMLDIRVGPECHFVAEWETYEVPSLAGRVFDFMTAVEAVRANAFKQSIPGDWLPEEFVPTGPKAVLFGFGVPVLLSICLMLAFGYVLSYPSPGLALRLIAVAIALVSLAAFGMQFQEFVEGFRELRYVDVASLLIFVFALAVPACLVASQQAALACLAASCGSGIACSAIAGFGWAPDRLMTLAAGVSLVLLAVVGISIWHMHARPEPEAISE